MSVVRYDTIAMHNTARAIQDNAKELLSDIQHFWTSYQDIVNGPFPTLNTLLSSFMASSQRATELLAQGRTDLGIKLDQAATQVEHTEEYVIRRSFRGN